jgi:hypothetical protein
VVVVVAVVVVVVVVPVTEASMVVKGIVVASVLSGSKSHISSSVGILWEAVLHVFAVCSA